MLKHPAPLIAAALLIHIGAAFAAAPPAPAQTLYTDALAKELAVRAALTPADAPPTVLKAVRTVVTQYEFVVRTYPTSGYCDDALWQAGELSLDAFEKFKDPQEKAVATRLLRLLASEYPTSKFTPQVSAQLKRADRTVAGQPLLAAAPGPRPATVPPPASAASTAPKVAPSSTDPATTTASRGLPLPQPVAPGAANAAVAPAASVTTTAAPRAAASIATIKDIRRTVLPDVVRVVIELDGEVEFHEERLDNPARVFVDLSATRTIPTLKDQTIRFDQDAEPVREVRLGRHPNDITRVVLEASGVSSVSVYPLYSPYRLIIDCARSQAMPADVSVTQLPQPPTIAAASRTISAPTSKPAPLQTRPLQTPRLGVPNPGRAAGADLLAAAKGASASKEPIIADATSRGAESEPPAIPVEPASPVATAPNKNIAGGFSIARQLGLGVSRIVIDPGHGGHDPGARGNGLTEAELVLDVALRLEKLLSQVPGVEVVLTRRTDEFVPLQERTAIANREGADLFLSIHANASTSKQARGIESYYLNFATNPGAEAIAARENAGSDQAMAALPKLLNTIALNNKLDESRDLAVMVQRSMIDTLKTSDKTVRDLGVKQAPFVVLIGAAMPSVLSEISFLTNAQEGRLLKGSAYRQRIAQALFNALRKYQSSLKTGTIAAARR